MWFVIGGCVAVIGVVLTDKSWALMIFQKNNYPIQGLAVVFLLGAITLGTVLWVIFGAIFGIQF